MNADAWFTIGSPHISSGTPCEDYALAGISENMGWAIISDGCSGAMARTDIGARTLSMAARRAITSPADDWPSLVMSDIRARNISDDPRDMFATLGMLFSDGENLEFRMWGDGAMMLRYKDGSRSLLEIDWADETPYYLQYSMMEGGLDNFKSLHAGNPFPITMTNTTITDDGFRDIVVNKLPIERGIDGIGVRMNTKLLTSATCFSDGISAIKGVSTVEAATVATAFKNHEGQFVARRLLKATREWSKNGEILLDDLSVASLFFGEES